MFRPIALLLIFPIGMFISAQQTKPIVGHRDSMLVKLDEVVLSANEILGSKFQARNRTGAAYYISPKELKRFDYTDINRVLRSVPGVTVYEEDGFGLRPNISLRGTSPERSAKITLMEDGVLIAPAPYSAPAAYYFPSVARMQAVEILKGSSQVQYGPFTTGGAINLLSLAVPEAFQASLSGGYGSFNSGRIHAKLGDSKERFGYAVEYLNFNSNGFKELDQGGDTGFDKNDLVAKFRYNSKPEAKLPQSFILKFQYSDEVSDETYLGLTDPDFNANPFRRYAASQRDQMTNDHLQFMGTHTFRFNDFFSISTTAYYNKFSRNWYKLDGVTINGQREGLSGILDNPESFPDYFALINGSQDADADALLVKANNRDYLSTGIQTKFDYHWKGEQTFHDIEVGLRYHYDEEDRFQWVDAYGITDGIMNLTTPGTPGTDANRISDARAFSSYALYKIKYKELTLTPGLRYESIRLGRINYGTSDIDRLGLDLSERENQVDVFIPGIGFNYNFDRFSLFGGIHKGFSPPTSREGEKAEESVNLELGTRFNFLGISGELIGFFNDYSNLLGSDLAATGGTGSLEQFNAGAVNVSGIELLLNYDLLSGDDKFRLPLTFAYTLTDTEFQNSFGSEDDLWGEVNEGDELPYIAKHQFNLGVSLEHKDFEVNLSGRYNGAFRTEAGSGSIPDAEEVPANFIVDLSGKYQFSKNLGITMNVLNLTDEEYAVARVPAGLRPGLPFNASLGFVLSY
ncbi:TonB-dependent receptor [Flavobacteriaceae bacterium D16]|nr:TonB-dependent receptor [Flavobacteriaceae bacterium D16]